MTTTILHRSPRRAYYRSGRGSWGGAGAQPADSSPDPVSFTLPIQALGKATFEVEVQVWDNTGPNLLATYGIFMVANGGS